MSKKNKKNRSYFAYEYGSNKKDRKKKKDKESYYEKPRFKRVKPTLDKKEAKESKKILLAPVDIPKDFTKNRNRCNHAGDVITVATFKSMTPNYAAYTPMLETLVKVFGEDNVDVCKSCYDAVVDPACLSIVKIKEAIAILYASANVLVSRKRMKNDEVKNVAEIKNELRRWNDVIDDLMKLEESGALTPASGTDSTETSMSAADLEKLSKSNRAFTV